MTAPIRAAVDGDATELAVRMVVAPIAGLFEPGDDGAIGERRVFSAGTVLGRIRGPGTEVDVASFCPGFLVRMLAHHGERVRAGQPLAWVHPVPDAPTGGARAARTSTPTGDDPRPASPAPILPLRFLGVGAALPDQVVSNDDLAARLDTSDEWIRSRTGIATRHVAGVDESTTSLAVRAAREALRAADLLPAAVELVVVATMTPDSPCPSTAARVAAELGIEVAAFDINAACSGFGHALHTVAALVGAGPARTALVIGAERMSTIVDPEDRHTAVLFGDGAGAVVVADGGNGSGILAADLGGAPSALAVLEVPVGQRHLRMDGPELYRRATRALAASARSALEQAGAGPDDVDLWIPHQANARIITAVTERLGIPAERVVVDLADRANTSGASIPLALASAVAEGRLRPRHRVLVSAIGAGLGWTSLYLRWGA
jgi:3-oxoacyl-[acyl-carrier-protein] synthase-3